MKLFVSFSFGFYCALVFIKYLNNYLLNYFNIIGEGINNKYLEYQPDEKIIMLGWLTDNEIIDIVKNDFILVLPSY